MTAPLPRAHETQLSARLHQISQAGSLVIAHRGDSEHYPENTLSAYTAAAQGPAEIVEFDVRETKDGVYVCIHDATLRRTTNATERQADRPLEQLSWNEVRRLDAGSWLGQSHTGQHIPSLAEALDSIHPQAVPMIEHKSGRPDRLLEEIHRLGVRDQVIVQSFDWTWLTTIRDLDPHLTLGLLGEGDFELDCLHETTAITPSLVHWEQGGLTLESTQRLHKLAYWTCTYTSDSELYWLGAMRTGLSGVTTNRPTRMARFRERLNSATDAQESP